MMDKPQHMARLLSWALADLMLAHAQHHRRRRGCRAEGRRLQRHRQAPRALRAGRVINTLLDEQSILGLGIGAAHNDLLAITEIQFLAYVHNAEDQIRGEAATLSFFSNGQYTNPMIIRIAGPRLPEGLRRPFPQRQQPRHLPRHSRPDPRLPEQRRRRRRDAARMRPPRARGAARDRLPRADRALHDPRPARGGRRAVDRRPMPRRARRSRSGSARSASTATAPTSPSSPTATAITSPARPRRSCASSMASNAAGDRPALARAAQRGRPARGGRGLRARPDRRRMPPDRLAERGADGAVRRARARASTAAGSRPRTASSRSAGRRP